MLLALITAQATPWHVPTHQRRVRLTYTNPTATAFTNFPMMVKLTPDRIDYSLIDADGWSMVVVDDSGTPLDFHIDDWTPGGDSWLWVRLPNVDVNGTDQFWVYYDSTAAVPAVDPSAPQAVWTSAAWLGVWPLDRVEDVTLRHPVSTVGDLTADAPGKIGFSRYFSGDDYIQVEGQENDFDVDNITVSAWVRRDGWGASFTPVITKGDNSWRLHRQGSSSRIGFAVNNNGTTQPNTQNVADDTWVQLHAVYSTSFGMRVYMDGQEVATADANGNIDDRSERVRIGHNQNQAARFWVGWLDMISVQNTPRGPNWITLDHLSQSDNLLLRCDSGPGLADNLHDADGDGVPCDVDCDDADAHLGRFYEDNDGDGEGTTPSDLCTPGGNRVQNGDDCDDADPDVNTEAIEVCNGLDDDCNTAVDEGLQVVDWYRDADGDGSGVDTDTVQACEAPGGYVGIHGDCDDTDPTVLPGAEELCDGVDNDCDGTVDVGASDTSTWYADSDGDSYGDPLVTMDTCLQPAGYLANDQDCDDSSDQALPGGTEICDGLDNDCDGSIDVGAAGATLWYADLDGDTFGDALSSVSACSQPAHHVTDATDCDDSSDQALPGGIEICDALDNDCNGSVDDGASDFETFYLDFDGDGYGDPALPIAACTVPPGYADDDTDCDDAASTVNPSVDDVCNGIDDDCSGAADEGQTVLRYPDSDGDSFGANVLPVDVCPGEPHYVDAPGDCDDMDPSIGLEQVFFLDQDGDLYGTPDVQVSACTAPLHYVTDHTDCNDSLDQVNPGDPERCSTVYDDDCDGEINEQDSIDALTYYQDDDNDNSGTSVTLTGCSRPAGYSPLQGPDCDDTDPNNFPGGVEQCDGADNNCNTLIDEDVVDQTFFADVDGDGFGDPGSSSVQCAPDAFYPLLNSGDCNDADELVNPDATEICDGIDNNCLVGEADASDASVFFPDEDDDGFGDATEPIVACNVGPFESDTPGDCDDQDGAINPAAPEVCDGIDNDCNGLIDVDSSQALDWYLDDDLDGYGTGIAIFACSSPGNNYTRLPADCDDDDGTVYPGALELCDQVDNDCDLAVDLADPDYTGNVSTYYADADADLHGDPNAPFDACETTPPDGYVSSHDDCVDTDATINPTATEVFCDGIDQDCSGDVEPATRGYIDGDGDGYGDQEVCSDTAPLVAAGDDCDDTDPAVNPGAEEVCDNLIDDDCQGGDAPCSADIPELVDSGCTCATGGTFPWVGLGFLLAAGAIRRRRA